jgi:hypothetical protein
MSKRKMGSILCLVAVALVLAGTFSKSWVGDSKGDASMGLGLLGLEECDGGKCVSIDWTRLAGRDRDMKYLGYAAKAAVGASLALIVVLGMVGVLGLSTPRSLGKLGTAAMVLSVLAVIGGIGTAWFMKNKFNGRIPLGWSSYSYALGAVLGIVGSILARRPDGPAATA